MGKSQSRSASKPVRRAVEAPLPLPETVALVLQGGGALGSYQAGVFEELDSLDIDVDWVAGISIGAVNAALIAGNPPERRLKALATFWETVSGWLPDLGIPQGDELRELSHLWSAAAVASWGVPGFFTPRYGNPFIAHDSSPEALSFYDTTPLRETLDALIDWKLVNDGPMRVSVGAVDIESGNFIYFDNRDPAWQGKIGAAHIMASGALPPGFAPVEIEGRHYWDGGIVSNTPLQHILDHQHNEDMLLFQVDLFPAEGPFPRHMTDVWNREKDIRYSSRTRAVTDQYIRQRREHQAMRDLLAILPPKLRDSMEAAAVADLVDDSAVNIVHLIYRNHSWETGARDFEFSRLTMRDHWQQGRDAVRAVIEHGDVLAQNIRSGETAAFDLEVTSTPRPIARKAAAKDSPNERRKQRQSRQR